MAINGKGKGRAREDGCREGPRGKVQSIMATGTGEGAMAKAKALAKEEALAITVLFHRTAANEMTNGNLWTEKKQGP